MKKIIVPTDFSSASKTAYVYARELAKKWDLKIELVHYFLPQADPGYPKVHPLVKDSIPEKIKALNQFRNRTTAPNDLLFLQIGRAHV